MARICIMATIISLSILNTTGLAQDNFGIEFSSQVYNFWGLPNGVQIDGEFCYITSAASGIQIYDISDPASPVYAGSYPNKGCVASRIVGQYLFGQSGTTMNVFDVSEPGDIRWISEMRFHTGLQSLGLSDDYVFGSSLEDFSEREVQVVYTYFAGFDVTNPLNPSNVYSRSSNSIMYFYPIIEFDNDRMYVQDSYDISVRDMNTPGDLPVIGSFRPYRLVDFKVRDNVLFEARRDTSLLILDVSDPNQPEVLGECPHDWLRRTKFIVGDNILCSVYSNSDLVITDISDLRNPAVAERFHFDSRITGYATAGNITAVSLSKPIVNLIDVSNPQEPETISTIDGSGEVSQIATAEDFAFVATRSKGLGIIDFRDTSQPVNLGLFNEDIDGAYSITVQDNMAYIINQAGEIVLVGLNDPENPLPLGWLENEDRAITMDVEDEFLYTIENPGIFRIYDISDYDLPRMIGSYQNEDLYQTRCLQIYEEYAYVGCPGAVYTIDFTDLNEIRTVNTRRVRGVATDIDISGETMFIADSAVSRNYDPGLWIMDISNPAAMSFLSCPTFSEFGSLNAVNVSNGIAALACGSAGIRTLNVSNPYNTWLSGSFQSAGPSRDIVFSGTNLISANQWNVGIYDSHEAMSAKQESFALLTDFRIESVYPNPFNSRTTVSFNLPIAGRINAGLFDMRGRRIMDISPGGVMNPGESRLMINADGLPAGSYVLRVNSGRLNDTATLLNVK